jgi:hypothetical protein
MNIYDDNYSPAHDPMPRPGPFLAKVVSHQDPTYMGVLEVQLLRPSGNTDNESQLVHVRMLNPFYGVTNLGYVDNSTNDYNNSQKSYGMWFVPPDPGSIVMVFFVDGDPKRGFWFGCVMDESMNFMLPGLAATEKVVESVDSDNNGTQGRSPVSEYNKIINSTGINDPEQVLKAKHPLAEVLSRQGLLLDDTRGITTSSARRETPSTVFGISTPGPIDKRTDTGSGDSAKKGPIGKQEYKTQAFVSRLGGTTFVMDDGDPAFLRKGSATANPPEYASVELGEDGGDVEIPHNELVRIRTRTGHQILLHNSEDLIYIGNAAGTSWIEMTSNGKIDIYAADSISVHSKNDINFYADRDINMEAGRNFNLKVADRHQTEIGGNKILIVKGDNTIHVAGNENNTIDGNNNYTVGGNLDINVGGNTLLTSGGDYDLNSGGHNNFTAGGDTNINSGGNHIETATLIHMNGPAASTAGKADKADKPDPLSTHINPIDDTSTNVIKSIMQRIPNIEPWPHHENLDPQSFVSDKTDRESSDDIAVPDAWKVYSTTVDTFTRPKPQDTSANQGS